MSDVDGGQGTLAWTELSSGVIIGKSTCMYEKGTGEQRALVNARTMSNESCTAMCPNRTVHVVWIAFLSTILIVLAALTWSGSGG